MKELLLVVYESPSGKLPFHEWLTKLKDRKARAVIRARLERVRLGNFGDCKQVGEGVSELRVDFGPGYRVYFGRDGDKIVVLLCGGNKKTQSKDIKRAKDYWKEYGSGN
ncbi:MAG: type II toxin-antitoxin system RelE/ParE family toxin [Candidatus Dadabacteria bacterium]|nr:MAG: type II toxin-antitoxin system RelE/ParE family toxin [Candidatus Dadabacteria bacterium]